MRQEHFARALRLRRLLRHGEDGVVVVPLDHTVTDGPGVSRGRRVADVVSTLGGTGVDAVVVHKGALRNVRPEHLTDMALVVHLSASTAHAPDSDAKYLVTGVDEAVRLGADAVSVHVNLGSREEATQVRDLANVAERCDHWNVPLLAMVYPRGPEITDPGCPELVAHAANLAADLGADVVKTTYPGSASSMAQVTAACPIPVLVAGGPRLSSSEALLADVREARRGGAAGVAVGRNVFQADEPAALARRLVQVVRGEAGATPPAALEQRAPVELGEEPHDVRGETVLA